MRQKRKVSGMMKAHPWLFRVVLLLLLIAVAGSIGALVLRQPEDVRSAFRTQPIQRGDLVSVISATGTVEPEKVVDVGAQVAGLIHAFGEDSHGKTIDYGSVVDEDTVLARIDDALYVADVQAAQAQLLQAQANQRSAEANVLQMEAKLTQAQQDWRRAQHLGPSEALAPSAYDQYKANFGIAKANVAVAQAAVEQAKAAQAQARAALARAQRSLDYCTIRSPIKGVIIDRRVNIGQTVVASLSAPSLFLIAADLRRVQVWVSVNEADIGSIYPDQPVTFTVDAFPHETFSGRVGKVRLNAMMSQNVVTYTVEVTTENPDGKLLPYLTANVRFETGRRTHVLMVPNTALHWTPQADQIAPDSPRPSARLGPVATPGIAASGKPTGDGQPRGTIWVPEGQWVRAITVATGLTDGMRTEIEGPQVAEELQVVVGEQHASASGKAASDSINPFTPQLGRARQRSVVR
jgi:HlyD family secretion protein